MIFEIRNKHFVRDNFSYNDRRRIWNLSRGLEGYPMLFLCVLAVTIISFNINIFDQGQSLSVVTVVIFSLISERLILIARNIVTQVHQS